MNFSREYLDKIMDIFPEVDFFSFLSEEHNHLLSNITVKQQNHIQGLLQQLLALQEETSPESDAMRKMLLATLLLELKDLCRQQQEQGGENGRVSNHIVDQIQAYIAEHYAEKLTLTGIASQFYISPYYLSRLSRSPSTSRSSSISTACASRPRRTSLKVEREHLGHCGKDRLYDDRRISAASLKMPRAFRPSSTGSIIRE